jgi:hypothetical protein
VFKEKSFYETDSLRNVKTDLSIQSGKSSKSLKIYSGNYASDNLTYAEIIPKGIFKYSAESGFAGQAEKVPIRKGLKSVSISQERKASRTQAMLVHMRSSLYMTI